MQRFENKYDLLNAAYADERIKKSAMSLLQYLVYKSNKEYCYPSVATIAQAMNVCERTVQYNMRKLELFGYVIRKDRWYNHQQMSNRYDLNFGVVEECDTVRGLYEIGELDTVGQYEEIDMVPEHMKKVDMIKKIYQCGMKKYEKSIVVYLIHKANKNGFVYGLISDIAIGVGLTVRTVIRILMILIRKGVVGMNVKLKSGKFFCTINKVFVWEDNIVEHISCDELIKKPDENVGKGSVFARVISLIKQTYRSFKSFLHPIYTIKVK